MNILENNWLQTCPRCAWPVCPPVINHAIALDGTWKEDWHIWYKCIECYKFFSFEVVEDEVLWTELTEVTEDIKDAVKWN